MVVLIINGRIRMVNEILSKCYVLRVWVLNSSNRRSCYILRYIYHIYIKGISAYTPDTISTEVEGHCCTYKRS